MSYKCHFPYEVINYLDIYKEWPAVGNHVLCTFNLNHIVLYINCPAEIAIAVKTRQNLRKELIYRKINWQMTPSFLTATHYSNWAQKQNMEHILGLTVTRWGFEDILRSAIAFQQEGVSRPPARIKWIREYDPYGFPVERGNLIIEISGEILENFLDGNLVRIDDITPFVRKQRSIISNQLPVRKLIVPKERPYEMIYDNLIADLDMDLPFKNK